MVAKTSSPDSAVAQLHGRCAGTGAPVVLLHGLFGAGGNLGALARHLQQDYTVCAPDLPGHGRSDWLAGYSLPAMAAAVVHWMDANGLHCASLVGHSLGGKVAMQLALQYPERVAALVVADIAPVRYGGRHDAVFTALDAVAGADCESRAQAQRIMAQHLREEGVIQFLLASLRRDSAGVYRWRFDHRGIRAAYRNLTDAPTAGSEQAWPGPVLFIRGADSDYLEERHRPVIGQLFPAAQLRVMTGCGHWLHVQKPEVFNRLVARFLGEHATGTAAAVG